MNLKFLRLLPFFALTLTFLGCLLACPSPALAQEVSRAAATYKLDLTRQAVRVFGREWQGAAAPIPLLAAQVQQESGWNPRICSRFACGLTQFTPATAAHMQSRFASELGAPEGDVRLNAGWAIRAQARYMHDLSVSFKPATISRCDRLRFGLSAYNGGAGWVARDRALATARGLDSTKYESVVGLNAGRAQWAIAENRQYVDRIIAGQIRYASWALGYVGANTQLDCAGAS